MIKYIFNRIETVHLTPEQLKEYEGIYYSPELDTSYQINAANDILKIVPESPYLKELKITKIDEFNAGLARIKFQRDANEHLIGFSIDAGRVKDIHFQRGEQ